MYVRSSQKYLCLVQLESVSRQNFTKVWIENAWLMCGTECTKLCFNHCITYQIVVSVCWVCD